MNAALSLSAFRNMAGKRGVDDPSWEIGFGVAACAIFVFGLLGWAMFARLDAAAFAYGAIEVSGERQAVQTLGGGIVSGLHVTEGAKVRKGQVLVEFASTEVSTQERSIGARVIGLEAEIARLQAERLGSATIAPPASFAALAPADRAEADRALAMEQSELDARRATRQARYAVLQQRVAQVNHQLSGYRMRQASNRQQKALTAEELADVRSRAAKGFATKTRVLALERAAAGLDGDAGAQTAEMARLGTLAGETRLQMVQDDSERAQANAQRLREAQTELQTLLPQWDNAREQLARTQLRAPVAGSVVGLSIHTIGGVAAPGQRLMEIVPADRSLVVEAQVAVTDANDLHVGQHSKVRITGLHGPSIPVLNGRLSRISADSFTDERSGRPYYTASVVISAAELARLRAAGVSEPLKPGTPVEVVVPLRARTALEYWLEPLVQSIGRSLHER
jgi:HlyD family secretion protein